MLGIIRTTKTAKKIETRRHYLDKNIVVVETYTNNTLTDTRAYVKNDNSLHPVLLPVGISAPPSQEEANDLPWLHFWGGSMRFRKISLGEIQKGPTYLAYSDGHILFDLDMNPVPLPHYFDYVGGLRERYPGDKLYAKLIALLKNHKFILHLNEGEIPYYNRSFLGQRGVLSGYTLPDPKTYREAYKYIQVTKGDGHWSVRLNRLIALLTLADTSEFCIYGKRIGKLMEEYREYGRKNWE